MSVVTFEVGNAAAMLLAASGLYFLPLLPGVAVAVLVIGFAMWSIPLYIKGNDIDESQKGYIIVGLLFFLAGYMLGGKYGLALGYMGFHFIFRYVFVLFCVDDDEQTEKEFQKRLAKVIKSYEDELNTLREQIKERLTPEEYEEKVKQFRLAIEAEYRVRMRDEAARYERKLNRLAKQSASVQQIQEVERKYQQERENANREQKAKIAEYVQALDKIQSELAVSRQETEREKARADTLEAEFIAYRKEQDAFIREREKNSHNTMLRNKEIRREIDRIINNARTEIDIISPWMTESVVDQVFLDRLNRAIKRGVTVKILYGIGDLSGSGGYNSGNDRDTRSKETAEAIRRYIGNTDKLHMKRGNEHSKLIICDDEYYIITSFNPLSFRGDYNKKDRRGEIGEISHDKNNLMAYRVNYFDFTGIEIK